MKIQENLDRFQPYLLGIRYVEGIPLLDVVLKEGWIIPDEKDINKIKGDDSLNYYMIFSENKVKSLDELLEYVNEVIKLNQEREQKNQLLRVKVNELKEFFKVHSLAKLNKLKFTFSEEEEFDLSLDEVITEEKVVEEKVEIPIINNHTGPTLNDVPFYIETDENLIIPSYLDQNGELIVLNDEEKEMLEEEARALRNIKATKKKQLSNSTVKPKLIINQNERDYD